MILYHGGPIPINDTAFCSETYFTKDIDLARQYGQYIYKIDVDEYHMQAFQLDSLNEHYISRCLIPMKEFELLTKTD